MKYLMKLIVMLVVNKTLENENKNIKREVQILEYRNNQLVFRI